jgi:hypothetical protein
MQRILETCEGAGQGPGQEQPSAAAGLVAQRVEELQEVLAEQQSQVERLQALVEVSRPASLHMHALASSS